MEKKRPLWQNPWAWIVGVVALWLATFAVLWICSDDGITSARVGDAFQCANALFAGLALAGMVYAILLQRVELRLQREELKLQRQELADTREVFKRQAEAQEKQEAALERQRLAMVRSAAITACAARFQAAATDRMFDSAIEVGPRVLTLTHQYGVLLRDLLAASLKELDIDSGNVVGVPLL